MRFNIRTPEADEALAKQGTKVGDVFFAKGGKGPRIHVIIAQNDRFSYAVAINAEGNICGVISYYTSVFDERTRVGHVDGLDELEFNVNWEAF